MCNKYFKYLDFLINIIITKLLKFCNVNLVPVLTCFLYQMFPRSQPSMEWLHHDQNDHAGPKFDSCEPNQEADDFDRLSPQGIHFSYSCGYVCKMNMYAVYNNILVTNPKSIYLTRRHLPM